MKSISRPRASSCRTSPACPAWSISPRCARPCRNSAAIPQHINPLNPAELVIDHSVQVDDYGHASSLATNNKIEFERNGERYAFLRWGQTAFRQLQGGAAQHRHRAPGEPRISRPRRVPQDERRQDARLSGHRGRHRFAHHDDQRSRRARLGRRRHRGRSRDARSARDHAHSAGHRLQDDGLDEARLHRHRSRAHGHRDAAQERRGRQVRGILRRWPRQPAARRSRDDRQHGARIRQHLRHLPDRRRNAALSRTLGTVRRSRSRWSRPMPRRRECGA